MALNPVAKPYYNRPPRDYPNMNALLGIRGFWDVGSQAPGTILRVDTPVVLGKVPALAFITYATVSCSVVVTGPTTPILDIGLRDPATGVVTRQGLVAAADLTALGITAGAGASRGVQASEQEVVAILGTSGGLPTAGRFNALVTFYAKRD